MLFDEEEQQKEKKPIFSVTEFIEYVNLVIGKKSVVVEGEITSFTVSQGKWVFFDLKEKDARVSCFTLVYSLDTPLEDGMQVRVYGTPRVHQKSGRFSIFVDRVELQGVGNLKRAFELTKAKLEKEGIFAIERKRTLPKFPQKIGMIASRESAAYSDFMRILHSRFGGLEIYLLHVHVQGEQAIKEIVGAFEWFNEYGPEYGIETLALIRGGGSLEDLHAFNSEGVARAVFGSRIPVVCGVGHERDETLADYAADVRAATPTHAASLIVPDRRELLDTINDSVRSIDRSVGYLVEWHRHQLESRFSTVSNAVMRHVQAFYSSLRSLAQHLQVFDQNVRMTRVSVQRDYERLVGCADVHLKTKKDHLQSLMRQLDAYSPLAVLKRGYSIVKKEGSIVKSVQDIQKGDSLGITLSDGDVAVIAK
ncbi:MAG: exodeoxyribonuclease VII large subunit [bacterium]|nr:exodeoxyribonuclease VII large subunit [bacterium]